MSKPANRYLCGHCLAPGFSTRLDTAAIDVGVYRVREVVRDPQR